MTNEATEAAGGIIERFSGSAARWFGWFTLGFCVLLVGFALSRDLGVEQDTLAFVGVIAPVTWVVLVRPAVAACVNGLLMHNMLRDVFVPWSRIERCRVLQTLQVVTEDGDRFHGVGLVRSSRSIMRARRHQAMPPGIGQPGRFWNPLVPTPTVSGDSAYAQQTQSSLSYQDYVERQIENAASGAENDALEPVVSWSAPAIAALAVSAICVAVMIL